MRQVATASEMTMRFMVGSCWVDEAEVMRKYWFRRNPLMPVGRFEFHLSKNSRFQTLAAPPRTGTVSIVRTIQFTEYRFS